MSRGRFTTLLYRTAMNRAVYEFITRPGYQKNSAALFSLSEKAKGYDNLIIGDIIPDPRKTEEAGLLRASIARANQ